MNRLISKLSTVAITIFFCVSNGLSQSDEDNKPSFSVFGLFGSGKQIIYAKKNDGLPEKIKAKGKIEEASISGKYCGNRATAGTLKIKLNEKVKDYSNDFLYVIVLCLAGKENENLAGKNIEVEVEKLTEYPYLFQVSVSNSIDSDGIPFYVSTVDGVGGLLKKLESKKIR